MNWLNKECADMSLREKAAQWCDKACEELIKKNEEIKKNLPPGAIPAISMVDLSLIHISSRSFSMIGFL